MPLDQSSDLQQVDVRAKCPGNQRTASLKPLFSLPVFWVMFMRRGLKIILQEMKGTISNTFSFWQGDL